MTLLTARSTAVSYPTDAALRAKRFYNRNYAKGALVPVTLLATGTLEGTWEAGIIFSDNGGVAWSTGLVSVSDGVQSPVMQIPNGALVGPTLTIDSGDPVISLELKGGSR